jgi:MoxR-like ATPase
LKIRERPAYLTRSIADGTDLSILKRAFEARDNALILGPPGCGKSLVARALAFDLGLPLYRVDFHDQVDVEDLAGRYHRIAGEWKWVDGVLTALVRDGGIFVCEEVNSLRPEAATRLHSLLDSRVWTLVENRGEVIEASPRFMFIGTANDVGEGSRALAARMKERFVTLRFGYDPRVEGRLTPDRSLLEAFRTMREDRRIRTPVSTRLLVAFSKNRRTYGESIAVQLLANAFTDGEQTAVREALGSVAPGKDLRSLVESYETDEPFGTIPASETPRPRLVVGGRR